MARSKTDSDARTAKRRLFLVDGSGLVYRSHFAFVSRPLTTSRGLNVGALLGFINTLLALIRSEGARFMAVALDTAGPTFRHTRYEAYKANRPALPPGLAEQLPYVERVVSSLGLTCFAIPGVEADDVIAALAKRGVTDGWEVVIVSADKDFAQLIGPGIRQYVPSRGREPAQWLDAGAIEARWGVRPDQFADFLALSGDSSDNIPGVSGIGPKTAATLLQKYGSLEKIYAQLESVTPPGVRARLERDRDNALLSRELVELGAENIPAELDALIVPDPSRREDFRALLEELEFRQLARRVFPGGSAQPAAPGAAEQMNLAPPDLGVTSERAAPAAMEVSAERKPAPTARPVPPGLAVVIGDGWSHDYHLVASAAELSAALAAYDPAAGPLVIDTETSSLDARTADLVGVSFAWRPGSAWYVPVGHHTGANIPVGALRDCLGPLLADARVEKAGQNLAFDMHALAGVGIAVAGPLRDTMVASYLRDPEGRHGLNEISREFLGHVMVPISQLIGSGRSQISMAAVRPDDAALYACEDVDAVVRLWPRLRAHLQEIDAWRLFTEVEMPLVPVLVSMERAGIGLDETFLANLGANLQADLAAAEHEIHRLAGRVVNVNSPRQLQAVLFDEAGLRTRQRTKTGFSTSQEVLEALAIDHPLPRAILEYRQLAKLLGTYIEALPRLADPRTGRVHAHFHQTQTATGRLSSSNPNLQNIPIRSARGREIRKAFVAPPGSVLLSADYSQVELRILAHLSGDDYLGAAFRAGADIHRSTAARIFGVEESAVDPAMRARAKTVNFGVLYGMGSQRLARELGIPLREASAFIAEYYEKLPGVKAWLDRVVAEARERGYAETLLGRRRYLPALHSPHARERSAAERMAINTPVQGSAADIIKLAMVRLHAELQRRAPRARLLLQVHDELVLEVPAEEAQQLSELARSQMAEVTELRVPLAVETGSGANWYEAHA